MLKRTISTAALATLSYLLLHFSHYRVGSMVFLFVVMLICGFGLYEFYAMVEKKGSTSFMVWGILTGLGYILVQFLRGVNHMPDIPYSLVAFVIVTIMFFLQILYKAPPSPLFNFSMTIVGMIYVAWLFSFILRINYYPLPGLEKIVAGNGTIFLLFAIIVTKGADSCAFLIGSNFGRFKLAPAISPNKTIEGAAAAVVGGTIIGALFKLLARFPVEITWLQILVTAFCISGIAQFGDLVESILKRDAKIKDSGNKFPGLGGVLDLIDSLLFALPATYFFMKLWIIG